MRIVRAREYRAFTSRGDRIRRDRSIIMPTMSQRPLVLILSVLLLHMSASLASPSFAGGNSFFLHTLPPAEQVSRKGDPRSAYIMGDQSRASLSEIQEVLLCTNPVATHCTEVTPPRCDMQGLRVVGLSSKTSPRCPSPSPPPVTVGLHTPHLTSPSPPPSLTEQEVTLDAMGGCGMRAHCGSSNTSPPPSPPPPTNRRSPWMR